MKEKEFYKGEIIRIVNSLDRTDILIYLHRLISNIVKAGQ